MDTGLMSIRKIFSQQRRHLVPLYQRPYVWKQSEQWEPLWDDIKDLSERILKTEDPRPHFLGAIVLDQVRKPTGYIETRWVIDGQQRLTTIQVLLECLFDICTSQGQKPFASALRSLTRNENPMEEPEEVVFKVWPTNNDQDDFRKVMDAGTPEELCGVFKKRIDSLSIGNTIGDAYLFFSRAMSDWLRPVEDGFDSRIQALFKAVSDFMRIVVIDLGAEDDAQLIFETLNARGTPLLPADLIKNYLFHLAQQKSLDTESLYLKYWAHFDNQPKYWRQEVRTGRLKRARIDTFFQYYLSMIERDDVLVTHLYTAFKDHVDESMHEMGFESVLGDIKHYATIFSLFGSTESDPYQLGFFGTLNALENTTVLPLLLAVFHRNAGDDSQLRRILSDIESYLIRRMVCLLTTKNYNRLFLDLLSSLDRDPAGNDADKVRQFLLAQDSHNTKWPDDAEFRSAWMDEPLYDRIRQSRIRIVLERLSSAMKSDKSELVQLPSSLTIEHLLPQKWNTNWPLSDGYNDADRDRILHTLGNLTLLTEKLNSSVSNAEWSVKVKHIRRYTKLDLNRYFLEQESWNEDEIRRRGELLFNVALEIWSRP